MAKGVKEVTEQDALDLINKMVNVALDKVAQKISASLDAEVGGHLSSFTNGVSASTSQIYDAQYQSLLNQELFLMPAGTRFFRQSADQASLVVEMPPMVRTLKFLSSDYETIAGPIAIPYSYFIFNFNLNGNRNGEAQFSPSTFLTGWAKAPIKSVNDELVEPLVANVNGLNICMGDNSLPNTNNISQYAEEFIAKFWESPFGADYVESLYTMKGEEPDYFGIRNDHAADCSTWSANCEKDPSYLIRESKYWQHIRKTKIREVIVVESGSKLHASVKQALQEAVRKNSWEMTQSINNYLKDLDITKFRKKKGDIRVLKSFMEKCVEDSTAELRKMYGADIQQILVDIDKKQEDLVMEILEGQKVQRPEGNLVAGGTDLSVPW